MDSKKFRNGIHLQPLNADPSNPAEGDIFVSDGTARPKGLYIYKDGNWTKAGGGAGDADTIHLVRATETSINEFTIKSIDDILPDPEGSDTLTGTLSIPSSGGEALLSNDDAHKVFKYASAASSQYDAFGISKAIPAYTRGKDLVVQFKYRTARTSGASADADYMVWIWDETNGVNTTTSSTGIISAGTAITLGTTAGMSVGDKIWVGETGGTAKVTEAHITEVVSGTQIKISETVTLTSGDRFVTGILTDVLTKLDAADDNTNLTGTDFKVVFLPPSNCASVAIIFQQLTSEIDSFLYIDNILISSEIVKKVVGRGNGEDYILEAGTVRKNNTGNLISITGSGISHQITVLKKCKLNILSMPYTNSQALGTYYSRILVNSVIYANKNHFCSGSGVAFTADAELDMEFEAGDIITFTTNISVITYSLVVSAEATANDIVIVESTDSVTSEPQAYTPLFGAGLGAVTSITSYWYRDGKFMVIYGKATSGTVAADVASITLPPGYFIDSNYLDSVSVGNGSITLGAWYGSSSNASGSVLAALSTATDRVYLSINDNAAPTVSATNVVTQVMASSSVFSWNARIPIAGWDANPKPLLALPTITYGQDAEHAMASASPSYAGLHETYGLYTINFSTTNWNTCSLLGDFQKSTESSRIGCRFTAKRRCRVTATFNWGQSGAYLNNAIFKNGDRVANIGNQFNTSVLIPSSCTWQGILEPGDSVYPVTQASNFGVYPPGGALLSFSILAEPEEGRINQAAIISQPVVFIKDVKSSGTNGGDSQTVYTARTLNTLEGDIAAVGATLSSNQFTLPAGKYVIEAVCPQYRAAGGNNGGKAKLYNVTDSKDVIIGQICRNSPDGQANATVNGQLTITRPTTFEIHHRVSVAQTTTGWGVALGYGDVEVYTTVKITRLK